MVYNSRGNRSSRLLDYTNNSYRVRFGIETAGNLLYLLSHILHSEKNADGHYKLFNIAFAQYAKADLDFVKNFVIDSRNAVAFHAGIGLALPYGNALIVPYEKRYFAGGANSVRGWSVRELGPLKSIPSASQSQSLMVSIMYLKPLNLPPTVGKRPSRVERLLSQRVIAYTLQKDS